MSVAVTVPPEVAINVGDQAQALHASPDNTEANSILAMGTSSMSGVITRALPFLGNIGTTPSIDMPDSHNAGDFGSFLT